MIKYFIITTHFKNILYNNFEKKAIVYTLRDCKLVS